MVDKSFEERVQEELHELRLSPDKQVWKNIHAELHAENKRRWLVWVIALLGLGGASALFYYQADISSKNARQEVVVPAESDTKPVTKTDITVNSQQKNKVVISQTDTQPNHTLETAENSGTNIINSSSPKSKQSSQKQPVIVAIHKSNPVGANTSVLNTSKQDSKEISKQAAKPATESNQLLTVEVEKNMATNKTETRQSIQTVDSNQTVQSQSEASVIPVIKNKRKRWRFFGMAELGMSAEIHALRSAGLAFDAGMSNVIQSGNSFRNSMSYKTPSRSNGMSWSIAAQAIQSIGRKWDMGISFGYNYYSSGIGIGGKGTVGATTNAAADENNKRLSDNGIYYLSTDSLRYTNRHHFLMAGIDVYRNFKLSNTASLRWRMGSGVGVLLSTNALHFDKNKGILYSNRSLVPVLQMNISTGLDLGIGKKQAFYIGPYFSYFPGTNSKEGTNNRHIFNTAVRASFTIPVRKK